MLRLYVEPLTADTNRRLCDFLGQQAEENVIPAVACVDGIKRNLIEMSLDNLRTVLRDYHQLHLECRFFAGLDQEPPMQIVFITEGESSRIKDKSRRLIIGDVLTRGELSKVLTASIHPRARPA